MLNTIQPKIRKIIRRLNKINDNNFIGFDKYVIKGAFHWEELENNQYYRGLSRKSVRLRVYSGSN